MSAPATSQTVNESQIDHTVSIRTWWNDLAPADQQWNACIGDYDLGAHVATGPTEAEAIMELIAYHEDAAGRISA